MLFRISIDVANLYLYVLPQMRASVAKAFVIRGKFRGNDLFHYKQTVLKGRYNVFPKTLYKLIYLIHGIIKKKASSRKKGHLECYANRGTLTNVNQLRLE